ncbi:hypothetical protein [Granulicoccus phenolivorans]|uniref:hypothetical protein n=1 Tax=Granulicoccus phenolivorans TaxID=266854 RepID=UPI000408D13F|nr:hypothetical protein [Granulicoccus phenolivorans]
MKWVRLDNSANIFLAARNQIDTKVFRLSAELDEEIDPAVLQQALDVVFEQYPLFRAVLRRGVFWYYLQESARTPTVVADDAPTVTHLYRFDSRELLFRVLYRGRRISLEIFHALTDGTGSLWFFQDLLTEYVGRRHPEYFDAAGAAQPDPGVKQEFAVDAYTHWFRAGTGRTSFAADAASAAESAAELAGVDPDAAPGPRRRTPRLRGVMRVRGVHSPDLRTRVVEVTLPVQPVLALARAEGVSLTIYLTAVFLGALLAARRPRRGERAMTVSVPINLRQFFPTDSGRNFFATTLLTHHLPEAGTDRPVVLGDICRELDEQFRPTLSRQWLERRIRRLVGFERNPILRVIPRPLKDRVLSLANRLTNRGTTAAMSNLGRVSLPEPVAAHVGRIFFHVSAIRPQFCMISHRDQLTVSFTSPFVETDYHAAFVRHFTGRGIPVTVNVTRVTEGEIAAAPR